YNGSKSPRLILATPIAFEDRSTDFDVPSGALENERLAAYAKAIQEVASAKNVGAIDLFTPTKEWFEKGGEKLTINGCHLSEAGYRKLGPLLVSSIYGAPKTPLKP